MITMASPRDTGFFLREQLEGLAFPIVEEQCGRQFGHLASEQGQGHNAPGDHGVDGDGACEHFGGVVLMFQDSAAALQHPVPLFDPPTSAIPTHAFQGLLERADVQRGQQNPPDGRDARRRMAFQERNGKEPQRSFVL